MGQIALFSIVLFCLVAGLAVTVGIAILVEIHSDQKSINEREQHA